MPLQRIAMGTSEGLGATLRSEDAYDEAPDAKVPPRASRSFPTRRSTVRILIVYEDDLNRDQTRQMQKELIQHLGRSLDCSLSGWKLKFLRQHKMLQMSTADATRQAIIMFFFLAGGELP